MTLRKTLWIHGNGTTPNYAAEDDRTLIAATMGGGFLDEAISPGVGAVGRGHGVIRGFAVTPNGTPNNTVKVAAGIACVRGTQANDQGPYVVRNDAEASLNVAAADGSNPRRDLVVVKVRDDEYPAFTNDDAVLEIIAGTPAGSPVDPTVPEDALVLARLLVGAGAGGDTIDSGDIVSLAPKVRATGGITPVSSLSAFPNPQANDYVVEEPSGRLFRYSGSAWVPAGPGGSLGMARRFTDQGGLGPSLTDLAGMSVTVTVPAAGRRIKVTANAFMRVTNADKNIGGVIREGTTEFGQFGFEYASAAGQGILLQGSVRIDNPSAGSHTYKASVSASAGTTFDHRASLDPGWIEVEDIGPAI